VERVWFDSTMVPSACTPSDDGEHRGLPPIVEGAEQDLHLSFGVDLWYSGSASAGARRACRSKARMPK